MSQRTTDYPAVSVAKKAFIAPCALLTVYGALHLISTDELPTSRLIIATWAYMSVIWANNILKRILNVFDDKFFERVLVGIGVTLFAVGWTVIVFSIENEIVMQRFFTVGPILFGLGWLVCRKVEEVHSSPALWKWWRLATPKFKMFAASVQGSALVLRGLTNELFIAVNSEILWVLSLALLPVVTVWCADVAIVRGIISRGGVYRKPTD